MFRGGSAYKELSFWGGPLSGVRVFSEVIYKHIITKTHKHGSSATVSMLVDGRVGLYAFVIMQS